MERYSPLERDNEDEVEDESLSFYPSLMELSMGQSPSLDDSREDLMTLTLDSDVQGLFGAIFRHFTVIANVPVSVVLCSHSCYSSRLQIYPYCLPINNLTIRHMFCVCVFVCPYIFLSSSHGFCSSP